MFNVNSVVTLLLYGLLGALLSLVGVSVVNRPFEFISILLVVLMIDVLSFIRGYR